MKIELEKNLQNNLSKFFKKVNRYREEFNGIQSLFEHISKRMEIEGFKCHQQFSFSLKNTMCIFQKVEYFNNITINYTINVIINEETLKVVGVTKNEIRNYNEIIF